MIRMCWRAFRACYIRVGVVSLLVVFTLENEKIVWTDKSSQTDKSRGVKTGRTNFQAT